MKPTPKQIVAARTKAGLTQTQAAQLVYACLRTWQHWEAGTVGMSQSKWENFKSKVQK